MSEDVELAATRKSDNNSQAKYVMRQQRIKLFMLIVTIFFVLAVSMRSITLCNNQFKQ